MPVYGVTLSVEVTELDERQVSAQGPMPVEITNHRVFANARVKNNAIGEAMEKLGLFMERLIDKAPDPEEQVNRFKGQPKRHPSGLATVPEEPNRGAMERTPNVSEDGSEAEDDE